MERRAAEVRFGSVRSGRVGGSGTRSSSGSSTRDGAAKANRPRIERDAGGGTGGEGGRASAPSLIAACLPCLRRNLANFGCVFSTASAKSLRRHHSRWNGQYAFWHLREQKCAEWHREQSARPSTAPQFSHSSGTRSSSWKCAAIAKGGAGGGGRRAREKVRARRDANAKEGDVGRRTGAEATFVVEANNEDVQGLHRPRNAK